MNKNFRWMFTFLKSCASQSCFLSSHFIIVGGEENQRRLVPRANADFLSAAINLVIIQIVKKGLIKIKEIPLYIQV